MVKTILFDLDGTLCTMDKDKFLKKYLGGMSEYFKDIVPQESFMSHIMKSLAFTVGHPTPHYFCNDVFIDHFCEGFGLASAGIWERFMNFYENEFHQYSNMVTPNPLAAKVIAKAKEKGYRLAISSNSAMPNIAITERVRWCGLEPKLFDFIPGMDVMHYCKPNVGFFAELADNLHVEANDCLVVGNDCEEDLIAFDLGMQTFLVADNVTAEYADKVSFCGNLEKLLILLENDFQI